MAIEAGRPFILVRAETSPDDVPVMARAAGVLTSLGGLASHAAVVARGWGVPAVVSAPALTVTEGMIFLGGQRYPDGATISIDGSTGLVYPGAVAGEPVPAPAAATLRAWAHEAGIEVRAADDGSRALAPGEPGQLPPVTKDDIIRCLSIKRTCAMGPLAEALLTTIAALESTAAELVQAGTVVLAPGSIQLTPAGAAQATELLETDRRRWGADRALEVLDAFLPLDKRIKATVTAWQLMDADGQQVVNDHTDPEYDAVVLADLRLIHSEVSGWLGSLAGPGWLSRYAARLDRAAAAVAAGDHRFVSSPRVDSYHSVWFELHEELIRLAGRTRPDEVASGRA